MFLFYFSMIAHEQKQQEMFVLHVDNLTQFTRKLQIWRSDVIQRMNWIIYCPQIILSMSPRFINCSTHTKAVLKNLKLIFWIFSILKLLITRNQEIKKNCCQVVIDQCQTPMSFQASYYWCWFCLVRDVVHIKFYQGIYSYM